MRADNNLIEDLLKLGESALGNLLGLRHECGAQAREKMEGLAHKLDLVSRREFDAAFAMLAKARAQQEELNERLKTIEAKLNLSSTASKKNAPKKSKTTPKVNLRSVKQGHRAKARTV